METKYKEKNVFILNPKQLLRILRLHKGSTYFTKVKLFVVNTTLTQSLVALLSRQTGRCKCCNFSFSKWFPKPANCKFQPQSIMTANMFPFVTVWKVLPHVAAPGAPPWFSHWSASGPRQDSLSLWDYVLSTEWECHTELSRRVTAD